MRGGRRIDRWQISFIAPADYLAQDEAVVFVVGLFRMVLVGKDVVLFQQTFLSLDQFRLERIRVGNFGHQVHNASRTQVLVLLAVRIDTPQFVHGVDVVWNSVGAAGRIEEKRIKIYGANGERTGSSYGSILFCYTCITHTTKTHPCADVMEYGKK